MNSELKKILMIATGGTIASKCSKDGLEPALYGNEILSFVPEVKKLCDVDILQLMNIDSTNVTPNDWLTMAKAIENNYGKYDGFVILHGTDTMAYTASVISYLIQRSNKPIVITGSQKPISIEVTDAKTNLYDSFLYCTSKNAYGVSIVFDGKVIEGTRAKKMRSKSYNAFSSINYPYKAIIQDGRLMNYSQKPKKLAPLFFGKLNSNVGLFKLIPGCKAEMLDYYFKLHDAVIIESFGTGGIPYGENFGFYEIIDKWKRKGKVAVMCTQVVNEGSDMTVYKVGGSVKDKYGFLESYDMTPESVVAKLMWILAITGDKGKIKNMFYKNVSNDILYVE